MKRIAAIMVLMIMVAVGVVALDSNASAEEIKLIGVITKLEISGKDAKEAIATLKDNKTENLVVITVIDDLTLDKFKDHRIVEGDEIRCKYEVIDSKNVSRLFRKTAGC